MKTAVKFSKPLKVSKNALNGMTNAELATGNLSTIGSNPRVVRQAKVEAKAESRGDGDQEKSLVNLQRLWNKEEVESESLVGARANNAGFIHNIRVGFERAVDLWSCEGMKIYRRRGLARTGIFADYTGGLIRAQNDVAGDGVGKKKVLHMIFCVATEDVVQLHPITIVEQVTTDTRAVALQDT